MKAGIEPRKRIERKNRLKNPKYLEIYAADTDVLDKYVASTSKRVVTEYELLDSLVCWFRHSDSLVGDKTKEEIIALKQLAQKVAYGNVLVSKHNTK